MGGTTGDALGVKVAGDDPAGVTVEDEMEVALGDAELKGVALPGGSVAVCGVVLASGDGLAVRLASGDGLVSGVSEATAVSLGVATVVGTVEVCDGTSVGVSEVGSSEGVDVGTTA